MSKTERAFLILERLTSGRPAPTHAELMRELGVQRSTLSDSLTELRGLGYVTMSERRYLPGARLLTFVRRASLHGDLAAGIRPLLESLSDATGETAMWVLEAGGHGDVPGVVVSVDQVESSHPIRFVGEIGVPYTMDGTAAGLVFLAFTGRSAHSLAGVTGVDADELDREAARVRSRGFAVKFGTEGATNVAAPVRDVHGTLMGVITIVGPTDRVGDVESRVWPALRAGIERLSKA